jgi:hypothetical protein
MATPPLDQPSSDHRPAGVETVGDCPVVGVDDERR